MIAEFLEASVNFQNGDIYLMYGVIFAVLAVICVVTYISDCKKYED
jgi:hypothetical protein